MAFPSITVIAVDITTSGLDSLKPIHRLDFLKKSDIHYVHVVQTLNYGEELKDKSFIEFAIIKKMKDMANEIIPYDHQGKVHYHCLFGDSPKAEFCHFLTEIKAELSIVATRKELEWYSSSFAHYVGMNACSDVLILRSDETARYNFKGPIRVAYGVKLKFDSSGIHSLKNYDLFEFAHIKVIHVCPVIDLSVLKGLNLPTYPSAETQTVIDSGIRSKLNSEEKNIVPDNFKGEYSVECMFTSKIKKDFCEMTNSLHSDFVVLVPENKKCFGGFIPYQLNHNSSNILLIRN